MRGYTTTLHYSIAAVWLINGLFCKILHFVPRHEQIVARILGARYSAIITVMIGIAEIGMFLWILSRFKVRLNAIIQIVIVGVMNVIEFILAPDLLLFGRLNAIFAFLFMLAVYCDAFYITQEWICKTNLKLSMQHHPFGVEAFFKTTAVITYAVPKEIVFNKIPGCFTLDTLNDTWAFIAVAMVDTCNLRPKGFPSFMGSNSFQIGYRIFVRYTNAAGKKLRGLYIIRSETDSIRMKVLGNLFTSYQYSRKSINRSFSDSKYIVSGSEDGFLVELDVSTKESIQLPDDSIFASWKEAHKFSGPLPFTFSYNANSCKVMVVQGVRQHWEPRPVKVLTCHIPFINSYAKTQLKPVSAFIIENVPYYWKKGVEELWQG